MLCPAFPRRIVQNDLRYHGVWIRTLLLRSRFNTHRSRSRVIEPTRSTVSHPILSLTFVRSNYVPWPGCSSEKLLTLLHLSKKKFRRRFLSLWVGVQRVAHRDLSKLGVVSSLTKLDTARLPLPLVSSIAPTNRLKRSLRARQTFPAKFLSRPR